MRYILTTICACLLLFSTVQVQGQWTEKMTKKQLDELYQSMTTLSKPAWGDRDRVRKRYAYLFPKLAKACKCNEAQISKMAIIQTDFITEAGIKESYLDYTESMGKIIIAASMIAGRSTFGYKLCDLMGGTYVAGRINGQTRAQAQAGAAALLELEKAIDEMLKEPG